MQLYFDEFCWAFWPVHVVVFFAIPCFYIVGEKRLLSRFSRGILIVGCLCVWLSFAEFCVVRWPLHVVVCCAISVQISTWILLETKKVSTLIVGSALQPGLIFHDKFI